MVCFFIFIYCHYSKVKLCTRGTIVLDIPCTNVQNTRMNLKDKTVELLEQTTETKKEIAINCNVSYRWLSYLSSNEDRGFDVNQVQRVYDYLTNHSPK